MEDMDGEQTERREAKERKKAWSATAGRPAWLKIPSLRPVIHQGNAGNKVS